VTGRQGDATADRQTPTGEKAYGEFAAAYMLLHVWIIASNREHVWQGYHIQNVNAYTSGLKTWMVRSKASPPSNSTAISAGAA
jgi:hypothetical protein